MLHRETLAGTYAFDAATHEIVLDIERKSGRTLSVPGHAYLSGSGLQLVFPVTKLVETIEAFGSKVPALEKAAALLERYRDRIINIHPSLLPSFKGAHAIADAMAYGVKVYGVTIHRVDETLDGGRIISQRAIDYDGDDADHLTEMIHAVEHELYIETINKLIDK